MVRTTTKQFVENRPHSGYSITRTISGYRVERWSTVPGDRTDQAWAVTKVRALKVNPHGQDWGTDSLGAALLRQCVRGVEGVKVLREGVEVK